MMCLLTMLLLLFTCHARVNLSKDEIICEDLRNSTQWPTRVLCGNREIRTYGWDVYNARCASLTPRFIVMPVTPEDVQVAVKLANQYGVQLTYRSGGHSYNCNSFGKRSMNLDLRSLGEEVTMFEEGGEWFMTFLPGTRQKGMKDAVLASGRDFNFRYGSCDSVGGMGYHLHGGWNKISEKWANESMVAMDVVTATGDLITIGEHSTGEEAKLWDGMRIAGSSFGIATSVTIKLDQEPLAGLLVYMVENTFEELLSAMVKTDFGVVGFFKFHQLYKHVIRTEGRTDRYFMEVMLHDWSEETVGAYLTWMMTYGIKPVVADQVVDAFQYWEDTVSGKLPALPSYQTGGWKYGQAPFEDIGVYMRFFPVDKSIEMTRKMHDEFYVHWEEDCSEYFGGIKHIQDPFVAMECRTKKSIKKLKEYITENEDYYQPNKPGSGYVNVPMDNSKMYRAAYYPTYNELQKIKNIWDPNDVFNIKNGIHPSRR